MLFILFNTIFGSNLSSDNVKRQMHDTESKRKEGALAHNS